MKRIFTVNVDDDIKIVGLQIAAVVQRKSDSENSVTFFTLSGDDIRENDEWLFKFNEKAERIATEEPCKNCSYKKAVLDYNHSFLDKGEK